MSTNNIESIKTVLITGANAGLGKECARQLALQDGVEKIYLGCRNEAKAKAAQRELEEATGKSIFEIVIVDVSNLDSVRGVVETLPEPIDALVMNAGGMVGQTLGEKTNYGVIQLFSVNVLGHVVLLEELLEAKKLTKVALYAGSEAARGIPQMNVKRPALKTSSVDEFTSICDGSFFGDKIDPMTAYGAVKYMAAMWVAAVARKHPDVRIITMSPGGTSGTEFVDDLPPGMKFMFKYIALPLMPLFGLMHGIDVGAKRYVDGLTDKSYESGVFYSHKRH
ncbi:MAG: SDR family NAD(P)-dependent oxidoreductase, partial [Chloroflexota bacterium]